MFITVTGGEDGDAPDVVAGVTSLVAALGFDPLVLDGGLDAGIRLEAGTPAFGAGVDLESLRGLTTPDATHPDR